MKPGETVWVRMESGRVFIGTVTGLGAQTLTLSAPVVMLPSEDADEQMEYPRQDFKGVSIPWRKVEWIETMQRPWLE